MTTTVKEIMAELKSMGDENVKGIFLKHGVKEPFFGVKIQNLKTIQKKIGKDYRLAKDLYATGNADAMYLAGLIADDKKMTTTDLQTWAKQAVSNTISEYALPWVAAGSWYGFQLATEWIDSKEEHIATAGWATLGGYVALIPDENLDLPMIRRLLTRVVTKIGSAGNRTRYTMNGFVIAVGCYVKALTREALAAANQIGTVTVDMNGTACKVPDAIDYIKKVEERGALGKKKKTVKC